MRERGGWRRESVREGEECEEGWKMDGGRGYGWREGMWMVGGEREGGCLSASFVVVVWHHCLSVSLLFVVVVLCRC
jgi:hypothetical protein